MQGKLLKTSLSIEVLYTALKNSWMKLVPSKPEPIFVGVSQPALSKENIQSIEHLLQAKPDITITEIIDMLQLKACNETVRKAVLKLGYRVITHTAISS